MILPVHNFNYWILFRSFWKISHPYPILSPSYPRTPYRFPSTPYPQLQIDFLNSSFWIKSIVFNCTVHCTLHIWINPNKEWGGWMLFRIICFGWGESFALRMTECDRFSNYLCVFGVLSISLFCKITLAITLLTIS